MLTIHGRTRDAKGHNTGPVNWDMIRRLKAHFKDRVPIIANGGIGTMDDFYSCLGVTGADGVMTSGQSYFNLLISLCYTCPRTL